MKINEKMLGYMESFSYISIVMRETLKPLIDMNTITEITWKDVTINEIRTFASTHTASEFDNWCESQGIDLEWLDITLTNINEGYYNVILSEYDLNVMYYNGELTYISEL